MKRHTRMTPQASNLASLPQTPRRPSAARCQPLTRAYPCSRRVRYLLLLSLCLLGGAACQRSEQTRGEAEGGGPPSTQAEEMAERDSSALVGRGEADDEPEPVAAADPAPGEELESMPVQEESGIEGRVVIGPACPVLEEGQPCPDRPFQSELRVRYASSGEVAAVVASDADGRFRVVLPPGIYIVDPGEPRLVTDPRAEPVSVRVEPDRFAQIVVRFDSGVR